MTGSGGGLDRVVVAALTRTGRGLRSELPLSAAEDSVPSDCVVSFDNLHTVPLSALPRHVTTPRPPRMAGACRALRAAVAC